MPTIDLVVSPADAARIQTAWNARRGWTPTVEDVRLWLIEELRSLVLEEERLIAIAAIATTDVGVT